MQGDVVVVGPLLCRLASLAGAERAGQLGQCEDALAVELPQFLLPHAAQQADVVGLLSLRAAARPKFAEEAVLVERQPGRIAARLEPLHFIEDLLSLPVEL